MDAIVFLNEQFEHIFGRLPEKMGFAPGRVNLIGEHTDYHGGHVFPCALTLGTWGAAARRQDKLVQFYSVNRSDAGIVVRRLGFVPDPRRRSWADYPLSMMCSLAEHGFPCESGVDLLLYGDLPVGAGLSSSASVEVLTGVLLRALFGFDGLSDEDLAKYAQYAENRFIGVNCGIMDQFSSALCKRNHAMLLDTLTLQRQYAPLRLEDADIIVTNSGVKHSLASSAYNRRRQECEAALRALSEQSPLSALCALTPEEWEMRKDAVTDPVCQKRARHAVYENQRTLDAFSALEEGDLRAFGALMNASHRSLRDDYEVSCPELDLLTQLAWEIEGVYGSRMTGGGFGGCTVSIVRRDARKSFTETIGKVFREKVGRDPLFYVVGPGAGAHLI